MSKGRWMSSHGYKIVHNSWWSAWWHAVTLNRKHPGEKKRRPYPCYLTDDRKDNSQTGSLHWHVGRAPRDEMWGY